jgi:hypothetical protein
MARFAAAERVDLKMILWIPPKKITLQYFFISKRQGRIKTEGRS